MNVIPLELNMHTDQCVLFLKKPDVNVRSISAAFRSYGATLQIECYKNVINDCYEMSLKILRNWEHLTRAKLQVRLLVAIGRKSTEIEKKKVIIMDEITNLFMTQFGMIDDVIPEGLPEEKEVLKVVLKLLSPPTPVHVLGHNPFLMLTDSMDSTARRITNNVSKSGIRRPTTAVPEEFGGRSGNTSRYPDGNPDSKAEFRCNRNEKEIPSDDMMLKKRRLSSSENYPGMPMNAVFREEFIESNFDASEETNESNTVMDMEEIHEDLHRVQSDAYSSENQNNSDKSLNGTKDHNDDSDAAGI